MRTLRLLIAARKQVGSPADARQIGGGRGISRLGRFERCKLLIPNSITVGFQSLIRMGDRTFG